MGTHSVTVFVHALRPVRFTGEEGATGFQPWAASPMRLAPTAVPAVELRTVSVEWPERMLLGSSSDVVLTFRPESGPAAGAATATLMLLTPAGGPTNTIEPGRRVVYSQPIAIPNVSADYLIVAVARLDAAGVEVSPQAGVGATVTGVLGAVSTVLGVWDKIEPRLKRRRPRQDMKPPDEGKAAT